MSETIDEPRQYKQPSRKGKKAWRKHVDVTEIHEGLEQLREEQIEGGVISELPSDQLFTIDATGSQDIRQKKVKTSKPLRADEILAQRSKIAAVDSRKRPANSKVTDGIVEPKTKRQRSDWVTREEWLRLKKVAKEGNPADIIVQNTASFDPWAVSDNDNTDAKGLNLDFLEPPKPIVAPKTLTHPPVSLAANGKQIPSVMNPKAGTSYNPSFEAWDKLLVTEGEKEIEAEKQRLEEQRVREELDARIEAAKGDDGQLKSDDESAWEGFESEYDAPEWLNKKRPERKTKAQRNKIKRRKEAEQLAKWQAKLKAREQQVAQAKNIAKSIAAKDESKLVVQTDELSSDDEPVLRKRPLGGKTPIPRKRLELVLPEELQDSLRLLKPEGNLLGDRFRTLLVQGKLEARNPIIQSKKAKRKATEKWTYKDFKINH
ncbi:hypothetical protein FQN57_003394 [Myotisia sp. PD_48]|nr:hypothetical protein FQN57_003394 [Myotisia sp. PD_48]